MACVRPRTATSASCPRSARRSTTARSPTSPATCAHVSRRRKRRGRTCPPTWRAGGQRLATEPLRAGPRGRGYDGAQTLFTETPHHAFGPFDRFQPAPRRRARHPCRPSLATRRGPGAGGRAGRWPARPVKARTHHERPARRQRLPRRRPAPGVASGERAPHPRTPRRARPPPRIAALDAVLANSDESTRDSHQAWLLAPCDLQVVKASGVTFVASLLERVIEEQARGDASRAEATRAAIGDVLGDNLADIVPGSPEAMKVKDVLIAQGMWSQYLEVGIGPDAEVFTKAPVLAAVGTGADVGIHADSGSNNPEPE